jgi:general L-amino acid transport system permease protein
VGQPPGDVLFHSFRGTSCKIQIGAPKQKLSFSDPKCVRGSSRSSRLWRWSRWAGTSSTIPRPTFNTGAHLVSTFERSAGFGIAQHLIDHYTESDSYARVFVIGLLNTLLVTFIGVILATLLGFIIGVARLSPNWMINKLATVYVEVFRNIPPLLQILFWYFAVFLTMPGPRNSHNFGDTFFVSSRGLNMPAASWPMVSGRLWQRGGGHRRHRADVPLGQQALRRDWRAIPQVLDRPGAAGDPGLVR